MFPLCQDVEVEVHAIVASVDANKHREKPAIGVSHYDVAQWAAAWNFNFSGEFFGHGLVRVFSGGVCLVWCELDKLRHFGFLQKTPRRSGHETNSNGKN